MSKQILVVIAVLASIILINASTYTVDETEQAVLLQFRKIVSVSAEAGLHFKIPFIQDVEIFERRVIDYDATPREIITKDKKTLVVDNYAKWTIIDTQKFYETVRNESLALTRIDDIIYSDLRNELGKFDFLEIVALKRQEIMDNVVRLSDQKCAQFGIKILDVRIKRADLPQENEKSVFERMRAERKKQANLSRSEGDEEALKIRAETDKQKIIIEATAYQTAEKIKGEGDAEALKIYANGYNRDPEFFQFSRTLEAYVKTLKEKTTIVIPPTSDFLKYLKGIDK